MTTSINRPDWLIISSCALMAMVLAHCLGMIHSTPALAQQPVPETSASVVKEPRLRRHDPESRYGDDFHRN